MQNLNIQNFESRHIYGHKSYGVKKGRQAGGISVYFKTALKDKISIVKVNDYGIIWLKLDSKMLNFDKDVYICCTYIPPPSSKVLKDVDFDFFEEIENNIEQYCTLGYTFIVGDLNSRTGL